VQLQVNFDDSVPGDGELVRRVEGVLEGALDRFGERICRICVRLRDLNSEQMGLPDKSCRLDARISDLGPVAVIHEAATLTEAIHGAADKLRRLLARELQRASPAHSAAEATAWPAPVPSRPRASK
jgi:hypothetical protein